MYGQENGKNMPILYGGSVSFRNALDQFFIILTEA
jgi:triosephosphate isomerase